MRRFSLFGIFLLLVAGLFLIWQHRFERSAAHSVFSLKDLRASSGLAAGSEWIDKPSGPVLRLTADGPRRNIVARMAFPGLGAVDFLQVRYRLVSKGLLPGKEIWEDGRGIIEWHTPADGRENDPIFSTRYDHEGTPVDLVMRPRHGPAVPVLRVEHLGTAGYLEIHSIEATVLRERGIWKYGRWLLMAGWVGWLFAWMRPPGQHLRAGALVAAVAWLFMGLYFVVPGPWKSLRALGAPFSISGESAPSLGPATRVTVAPSGEPAALQTVGEIPQNGDFTLTLKLWVAKSKWILHVALLFAPTLLTACLVGRKPALALAILFSLAVETAQIAFGYGCDPTDLVDLAADAAGILLALVVHRILASLVFTRARVPAFFATA